MNYSAAEECTPDFTKPSSRSSEEMRIILSSMVAGLRSLSLYSIAVNDEHR